MNPQKKLEEIKDRFRTLLPDDLEYFKWLIARVEQLEGALSLMSLNNADSPAMRLINICSIAVNALNTDPKVSSSLSEKPE